MLYYTMLYYTMGKILNVRLKNRNSALYLDAQTVQEALDFNVRHIFARSFTWDGSQGSNPSIWMILYIWGWFRVRSVEVGWGRLRSVEVGWGRRILEKVFGAFFGRPDGFRSWDFSELKYVYANANENANANAKVSRHLFWQQKPTPKNPNSGF